jgi:polygalacturonase
MVTQLSDKNVPLHLKTDEEWCNGREFLRPVMISLQNCTNVFLQGVIFQNSPAGNLHPLMCENVIIDGVQVRNPSYRTKRGYGLDLESCRNTIVVNSTFDVGDDSICIKSGKTKTAETGTVPTENLIVYNCTGFSRATADSWSAVEMSGG